MFFFNDSENHIKSSLRTRIVWELIQRSKTSVKTMSNALRLCFWSFFQIARKLKNISKTNVIWTFFVIIKIHLEKFNFCFVARLRRNGRAAQKLSHVCGGFNEKKSHVHLRPFFYSDVRAVVTKLFTFSSFEKKVLVAPAPLTILTKHIVRLRRRCSREMCSTSAAPLLVMHETSVKSSQKNIGFLTWIFKKCL